MSHDDVRETAPDPYADVVVRYDSEAAQERLRLMGKTLNMFPIIGIVSALIMIAVFGFLLDGPTRIFVILFAIASGITMAVLVPRTLRKNQEQAAATPIDQGVAFTMGAQGVRLPEASGGTRDVPWGEVALDMESSEGDDPTYVTLRVGEEKRVYVASALSPAVSELRETVKRLRG